MKAGLAGLGGLWLSMHPQDLAGASGLKEREAVRSGEWFYSKGTQFLLLPLRRDWTYDDMGEKSRNPELLTFNDSAPFQARNIQNISVNGVEMRVGEIPHMGSKHLVLGILEAGGKAYYEPNTLSSEILSGFTYTADIDIYPNKVMNILEGAKNLLEFQEENGGFADGEYSFLQIQNRLIYDRDFRDGYNSAARVVFAGGICAGATLFCKSMFTLTQRGKADYLDRSLHPFGSQYFSGPASPEMTEANSDATVAYYTNDPVNTLDFAWRFKGMGKVYLWVETSLVPVPEYWQAKKGVQNAELKHPADARLVMTLTWRKTPPPATQLRKIKDLRNLYDLFREKGPDSMEGGLLAMNGAEKVLTWNEARMISQHARQEFKTADFQKEIARGDFGAIHNAKAKFTSIAWVNYLSGLGLSFSPVGIGMNYEEEPGAILSHYAKNALASADNYIDRSRGGFNFVRIDNVSGARVGDVFIHYAGLDKDMVGVVVGKKTVKGEIVLLVTDADRKDDGEVHIYQVDKDNFRVIFSEGEETPPVVIRKA